MPPPDPTRVEPSAVPRPGQFTAMISSTALDLPRHRAPARQACLGAGVFPTGMEQLPARDGPGGMGKSSLAVCAAYDCPPGRFRRIVFVSVKDRELDDDGLRELGNFLIPGLLEMLNEISRDLARAECLELPAPRHSPHRAKPEAGGTSARTTRRRNFHSPALPKPRSGSPDSRGMRKLTSLSCESCDGNQPNFGGRVIVSEQERRNVGPSSACRCGVRECGLARVLERRRAVAGAGVGRARCFAVVDESGGRRAA